VQSGSEKMVYHSNPWDLLAVEQRRKVSLLFNCAQYRGSIIVLEETEHKVSNKIKPLITSLKNLIEGYDLWDRFQHKKAIQRFNEGFKEFCAFCAGRNEESYHAMWQQVEKNFEFLKETTKASKKWLIRDLIANSIRRSHREHKYDDATARLYRAIEAYSGIILKEKYGINPSTLPIEKTPESLKNDFIRKHLDEKEGVLKIPLYDSYRLLEALGDEAGTRFIAAYQETLKSILSARNSSILAHGFDPIKEDTYEKLLKSTMDFTELTDEDLPSFPELIL
jgi:CRISPR-associated protein (TIGR02710 family)